MPVELRKRKAPAEPAPPPPAKKKTNPVKAAVNKAKAAVTGKKDATTNGSASAGNAVAGSIITVDGFGGDVETNDGEKTTLKKLLDASKAGVVLFTYPKASTPGCTTQACMFRDDYTSLTATGFSIFGLSRDSPKANTSFKNKQNLPYALLCDPSATLIGAIGLKKTGGTIRGVFVVDKSGKVLVAEAGGPGATVAAVKKLVGEESAEEKGDVAITNASAVPEKVETTVPAALAAPVVESASESAAAPKPSTSGTATTPATEVTSAPAPDEAKKELPIINGDAEKKADDTAKAKVAADVADTAAKLDPATPNPS